MANEITHEEAQQKTTEAYRIYVANPTPENRKKWEDAMDAEEAGFGFSYTGPFEINR